MHTQYRLKLFQMPGHPYKLLILCSLIMRDEIVHFFFRSKSKFPLNDYIDVFHAESWSQSEPCYSFFTFWANNMMEKFEKEY